MERNTMKPPLRTNKAWTGGWIYVIKGNWSSSSKMLAKFRSNTACQVYQECRQTIGRATDTRPHANINQQ